MGGLEDVTSAGLGDGTRVCRCCCYDGYVSRAGYHDRGGVEMFIDADCSEQDYIRALVSIWKDITDCPGADVKPDEDRLSLAVQVIDARHDQVASI